METIKVKNKREFWKNTEIKNQIKYNRESSKDEIEVPVKYIERTAIEEGGARQGSQKRIRKGKGERERVEVKADGRTDGRQIPDKWIKRKLLNSV